MMNDKSGHNQVSYLGPAGSYTHSALLKFFGLNQACLPVVEIQDVFSSVEQGLSEFGIVPVENSTQGSITITLDTFAQCGLSVCGEVLLPIHHCLLLSPKNDLTSIHKILSHQQSLGQCRHWLQENYPKVEKVSISSNSEAARIAASENGVAAIAGKTAADLYGLNVVSENIEDTHDNTTRFWVLSRDFKTKPTGSDKTSIIIFTHNESGALFNALEPFQRFGVSLSKLESRPSRKEAWSYSFFVDVEGHVDDAPVKAALAELKQHVINLKILGSYPTALSAL